MEDIKGYIKEKAQDIGIEVTEEQAQRFQIYAETLIEWNEKMNLTALKEPKEIAMKHFIDSLSIFNHIELTQGAKVIDIGSGAGFPGLPLKIHRRDIELTLLDSLQKRLKFLEELSKKLQLPVNTLHARAEEAGKSASLRMKFDLVTARAVAPLNILCEYCLPFVRIGGVFLAMKGPNLGDELKQAENAIKILGCKLQAVKNFTLPDGSQRSILLIERSKKIAKEFPRHGSKIAKKPL